MGLVCEGQSDCIVFEAIIQKLWPEIDDVRWIQPEIDAIGRDRGASGWTGVKQWCEANAGQLASVIDPDVGDRLALLVIAIDVDIAIAAKIDDAPHHGSAYDASRLCAKVKGWLKAGARRATAAVIPPEVVIAVPAMATESWVIASLYSTEKNPETIAKPTAFLVEKKQLEWDPDPVRLRKGKAKKLPARYQVFARQIVGKLARVRKTCPEADRTCRKIEQRRNAVTG